MANQHPLTPSPELVQQWVDEIYKQTECDDARDEHIATRAAQWGADQELEACCEWLHWQNLASELGVTLLRAARRPKPPTLHSIALQMLGTIERDAHYLPEITDTIRKALEQLRALETLTND
jgi:hypothetical protein